MKRLFKIAFFLVLLSLLIWFFVTRIDKYEEMACRMVQINFIDTLQYFSKEYFLQQILKNYGNPVGKSMQSINVKAIHDVLKQIHHIKEIYVYKTPDGVLIVEIRLRKPLIRVFDSVGNKYLVDEEGHILPDNLQKTLWLMCVNGNIPSMSKQLFGKKITELDTINSSRVRGLYNGWKIAKVLNQYKSFDNLISQIFVNEADEFFLVPVITDLIILFGSADRIEEKVKRLEVLFRDVFPFIPKDKYESVNISVANQFIMKKRKEI